MISFTLKFDFKTKLEFKIKVNINCNLRSILTSGQYCVGANVISHSEKGMRTESWDSLVEGSLCVVGEGIEG